MTALRDEPFEHGYSHPAEQILEERLKAAPVTTRLCLTQIMRTLVKTRPLLASDLLGCLGRIPAAQVRPWGHSIAATALQYENVAVRDAAVRALEQWGDTVALDLLRTTNETVAWLRRYIEEVVQAHQEL